MVRAHLDPRVQPEPARFQPRRHPLGDQSYGNVNDLSRLSDFFGRPAPLPDWALEGAIVGLKAGAASFGRRLLWDWRWNGDRYPDLPGRIATLRDKGIRFLPYANPYLAVDGALYREARAGGHLARNLDDDEPRHVDFGEFDAAMVDFTRAETRDWFAERILGREMLDQGIAGWMADFGEYLPVDLRLADGSDPMLAHNR
jgi:alpha-glucosidase